MKLSSTRLAISVIILFLSSLSVFGAESAASLLDKVRAKFSSSPSVEALFTVKGADKPLQGSAVMAGSSYALTTPQLLVWFDGKTQWAYMKTSREVNVSEPDADEIMEANPFAILTSHSSYYSPLRLQDKGGLWRVRLTPRDKNSQINEIVISINPSTSWPENVSISFSDDRKIDLHIDKISVGKAVKPSAFRYDPSLYPASEIIDLR